MKNKKILVKTFTKNKGQYEKLIAKIAFHTYMNYNEIIDAVAGDVALKATKYISPKQILRAVRTTYGGKINKQGNIEITLTIGKPNFLEREFIKLCQKSGEPFPVKKVQLKLYNPKKNNLKRKS